MPSKNVLKDDVADSYYHVYFRGGNRSRIFREDRDYERMLQLFSRYLSLEDKKGQNGHQFPNYHGKVELISFCLMHNHVHMFLYQYHQGAMTEFMRSLLTSYSMYFNKKYHRSGPLFESRYKASLVANDAYFMHITRYIHLNPRHWREYEYSSLPYYLQQVSDDWIQPRRVLEQFSDTTKYLQFVEDYEEAKEIRDIIKSELADSD